MICDAHGGAQEVIALYPRDDHPFYRMSFSDGTSVVCGPEHLWLAWRSNVGRKAWAHEVADARGRIHGQDAARVMRTDRIIREMERGRRYRVPLCEPAAGNFNRYQIDGYALGAFLGDGHMAKRKGARLSGHQEDVQVMQEVARGVGREFFSISSRLEKPHILTGSLSTKSPDHVRLRDMGMMGKRAWEKELPSSALLAPVEWRWSLLQGLMDTDGWVEEKRCAYYCTTSPGLRDGVAALARSLGCLVTVTDKFPTYSYKGEMHEGRPAWTLRIKSATPEKLFRLARKKEIASRLEHQSLGKEITDIEYIGKDAGSCIQVDHPSGLYLTDDYTVTHNSALIALLALLKHHRTVIFRFDAKQLRGLVDDLVQFAGTDVGLNRQQGVFYLNDRPGHMIEWGGIGAPGSENVWRGRAHDFIAADEVTELSIKKLVFLSTWLRTVVKGQRMRMLYTFNPPGGFDEMTGTVSQGKWVIRYFAPWIDERHENPAEPGEYRYFLSNEEGEQEEVPNDEPREIKVEKRTFVVVPQSRTFVPAFATDNPYQPPEYVQTLLALPKDQRARMLLGSFRSTISDVPNQALPTTWVDAAMGRWSADGARSEMTAVGLDVARGGDAFTVAAPRHGLWFGKLHRRRGRETPTGAATASFVAGVVRHMAWINVDVNGVGSSAYERISDGAGMRAKEVKVQSRRGLKVLPDGKEIYNLRAWLYWLMRLLLDPDRGFEIALPPDDRLRDDLITPLYSEPGGRVLIESKDDLRGRIGRSTDDGDAVLLSLFTFFQDAVSEQFRSKPRFRWSNGGVQGQYLGGNPRNNWMSM